jgi:Holliday junction resolvasome RuvABC DNA-binding subunit
MFADDAGSCPIVLEIRPTIVNREPTATHTEPMNESLLDLTGVGPVIASRLTEAGFTDVASVADADAAALASVHGIGMARAEMLRTEARQPTGTVEPQPDASAAEATEWAERAKELKRESKRLSKRAESTKSKKKRKRRRRKAAEVKAAAKEARRKAKRFRAG